MTMEAGILPIASHSTIGQTTFDFLKCTTPPKNLEIAAYSKSVPTAICGSTFSSKIKIGVISDPPPTPVTPTQNPTKIPAKIK